MKIGTFLKHTAKFKITNYLYRLIGSQDLHSHIRLKLVFEYLNAKLKTTSNLSILEIGCGSGIIPLQLLENKEKFTYVGIDKDNRNINSANKLLSKYDDHSILFLNDDIKELKYNIPFSKFDIILMIDIIEHLDNPREFLKILLSKIKQECVILVSVPTPLYPIIFGRKFHNKVGHVLDGYTREELDELFGCLKFKNIFFKYNTGLISNLGCAIYYRIDSKNRIIVHIKTILLYFTKYLDLVNNKYFSCSIFSVYKKK